MAQMADVVAASPAVTEERLDAQVLDAALGEESDAAADVEMPLDRTASQLDVYHRLEAVLRRVADRRAPIQELARSVRRLGEDAQKAQGQKDSSLLREVAGGVEKVRKLARNFGEDLLEDMLAMDKLSGFAQADRSRRKAAIAEIEGMLDQVDPAKARLVALGKELSASLEALTKEEEQEEVKDEDGDEAMEEASPRPDAASGARPARAPPTLAPVPAPAREAVAAAGAAGAEAAAGVRLQPPGRELWQQVALPVRFRAHEDDLLRAPGAGAWLGPQGRAAEGAGGPVCADGHRLSDPFVAAGGADAAKLGGTVAAPQAELAREVPPDQRPARRSRR